MSLRSVVLPLVALAVVGGAAALTWMVVAGSGGATLEPADGGAAVEPSAPGDRPEPAPEPVRERQPRPADPPADGQPWVPAPGLEDALAAVPWAEAGGMMRELVPLLADAAIAAVHADMIRDGDAQRATELRWKLAALAQAHPDAFRSIRPEGSITHPAFAANLAAATLHARSAGLSAEQLETLAAHVAEALRAESEAARTIDTTSFIVSQIGDEYERRRPFFDALDGLLTEKQRTALHAAATRDRVRLDPLSAAAVFDDAVQVILVTDIESQQHLLAGQLLGPLNFGAEREEQAFATLRVRLEELDPELLPAETGYTNAMGFVRGEHALRWVRWASTLTRELIWQAAGGRLPDIPPDVLDRVPLLVRDPASAE